MRRELAALADERLLYGPHEERLADLALRGDVDHRQDEVVPLVLDRVVNLRMQDLLHVLE